MALSDTKSASESLETALHYKRIAAFTLLGVTLLRLVWLAGNPFDLYPDEAQYWLWAQVPSFGYFSKPPLVAWLIALTTRLFGDQEFGIRVASPLLHFATGFAIYGIGRGLYDSRIGCWSAVVYITLPAVSVSAAILSTDVPLMFFWAVALYAFVRAREEAGWRWWIVVGIATGFGLLAKYAMAYWLLSAFLLVLAFPDERRHLKKLLAAGLLALLIYSPNFVWNLANGFVSYRHTQANANLSGPLFHPQAFLEFASSQFGVFGPILFGALLLLVIVFPRRLAERRARLLAVFALPTLAMMLVVSFLSRAHPNWAAPTYVSATILVVAWLVEQRRTALLAASVALHVAAAVFLAEGPNAAAALGKELPAKFDLLHRVRGWSALGRTVGDLLRPRPGTILLTNSREDYATLVYYARPHPFDAVMWNSDEIVHNQFDMTTDMNRLVGHDFLFVTQNELAAPDMAARFTAVGPPVHITIPVGAGMARRYFAYELDGFKGYR
jgi:4-amino-4-deoxy-L-arabinose transferase-like glycosyltransferase